MNTLTIRKTPFLFFRYLVIIEFFFAFLPLILAVVFPVQAEYNQTVLAQSLSFNLLLTIVVTFLQILILIISFFSWYLPTYKINQKRISYRHAGSSEFQELITVDIIRRVEIYQRGLGRRFDYGTLLIYETNTDRIVKLKDIPDPVGVASQIEKWVAGLLKPYAPAEIKPADELIAEGEVNL